MEKKAIAILALGCALAAATFAAGEGTPQEASFAAVTGKVSYQVSGGDWQVAHVGDSVARGTIVSTGFKSTAVLKLGPTSITLKPLTRLTLEELLKTSGGTQTRLFLLSGRVKADVPPQAGQTTAFSVRSPTATASVRGTAFEFDGMNLLGERGAVRLQSPTGQFRFVGPSEFSSVGHDGSVGAPAPTPPGQGLDRVTDLLEQAATGNLGNNPSATNLGGNSGHAATLSLVVQ